MHSEKEISSRESEVTTFFQLGLPQTSAMQTSSFTSRSTDVAECRSKRAAKPHNQILSTIFMYYATQNRRSLLFSRTLSFLPSRAAPYSTTGAAASSISLITSVLMAVVVLHSFLKTSDRGLLGRMKPGQSFAHRFPSEHLLSRELQLLQHRAVDHLVFTERSSVMKRL